MIAVDSNLLIDVIGDDAAAGEAAVQALRAALQMGPVVACDVVVAEVVAGLGDGAVVVELLEELGIDFHPLEQRAAVRAGEMQRRYNERRHAAGDAASAARTVPDFLIGAHALMQCKALISRDAGFFRDYFKGLKVIVPKAS